MNVPIITQPNNKGQIVIPAKFRKKLGINKSIALSVSLLGQGIYVQPVKTIPLIKDDKGAYLDLLKRHRGAWGKPTKEELKAEQTRRKQELTVSERRFKAW